MGSLDSEEDLSLTYFYRFHLAAFMLLNGRSIATTL
jgi:hypothetical protein